MCHNAGLGPTHEPRTKHDPTVPPVSGPPSKIGVGTSLSRRHRSKDVIPLPPRWGFRGSVSARVVQGPSKTHESFVL